MRSASLPMYDADREAVGRWWSGISCALRVEGLDGVPDKLEWPEDLNSHWRDPRLLLSQTCGYPLVTTLGREVQVLGAFHYTAPGCCGFYYRSELVARIDADSVGDLDAIEVFRGRVAAINSVDSHSGCNALRGLVAPLARDGAFFAKWFVSGSHRASLSALQSGAADIAAIDCVSLAGFQRHAPRLLRGLRIVGSTASAPGLPLVTAATTSPSELQALRKSLFAACSEPALAEVRAALFIRGFEVAATEAWQFIEDVRWSARDVL